MATSLLQTLCPSLLLVLLPPSSSSSSSLHLSLRNTSLYPACVSDSDCHSPRRCFQYMCYPWQTSTGFRWCNSAGDCKRLLAEEGGEDKDGGCYRHEDRKQINFGICLPRSEMRKCSSHDDCPGGAAPVDNRGGAAPRDKKAMRCTNEWCGEPAYFAELGKRECHQNSQCQNLLTGQMCCYDFSSPRGWQAGEDGRGFRKKCCHSPSGSPVIPPPDDIGGDQLGKLDQRIHELALVYMDMVVCEALKYPLMEKLSACREWTTTTTSTPSPRKGHRTSSSPSLPLSLPLLILAMLAMV